MPAIAKADPEHTSTCNSQINLQPKLQTIEKKLPRRVGAGCNAANAKRWLYKGQGTMQGKIRRQKCRFLMQKVME